MEKPEPYINVWITYKENGEERTDLGFYVSRFNHYASPPIWITRRIRISFLGNDLGTGYAKLPNGFGEKQINYSDVISWKYENETV